MILRTIPSPGRITRQIVASSWQTASRDDHPVPIPVWKRSLDVTFILLSLPLWLPCMILLTLWIKIVSPGPVFFRQKRVGYQGRIFMILKFRSMKVNAETRSHESHCERLMKSDRPMTKLDAVDPRIIPGGRLLRTLGLDELPQLINVLRGEMSIVGPRPCLPKEFESYDGVQRQRVTAPPGLTGYWQVNGKNRTTFAEMIEMDLFYAENMGVRLDLWIMLRTAPALVKQLQEAKSNKEARTVVPTDFPAGSAAAAHRPQHPDRH